MEEEKEVEAGRGRIGLRVLASLEELEVRIW